MQVQNPAAELFCRGIVRFYLFKTAENILLFGCFCGCFRIRLAVFKGDYGSVVSGVDVIFNFIRFQNFYQRFDRLTVFVSFFYSNDIYIGFGCFGVRSLISQSVFCYREAGLQGIVSVQNNVGSVINDTCYLFCCQLYDFYIVRILRNIVDGSFQSGTVFQSNNAVSCRSSRARASFVVSLGTAMVSPSAMSSRLSFVPG